MQEIKDVNVEPQGDGIRCVLQCALLCGACGITPIPGDEFYGLVSGGLAGAADWA